MGRHAHRLDLTCRPFLNRVVEIESSWPVNIFCFGTHYIYILHFTGLIVFFDTTILLSLSSSLVFSFSCFKSMALEKYGPHHPTIIESKHIKNLYELWGIDYTVGIEAPEDGENLETVWPGYCGAYTSHFQDGGLSFPLPRFLLEALTELGMAFAQMATNFWRYFLTSWIRAREEGLRFSLEELKKLFSIKRNNGFPGTMILAYRPSRSVIDDIPNRDNRWREKFFVFKINPASVGDFDFETIPRVWSDEIGRFFEFLLFFALFLEENFTLRFLLAFSNFSLLICRTLWFRAYDSRASRANRHFAPG